jgi:hypothetical protein
MCTYCGCVRRAVLANQLCLLALTGGLHFSHNQCVEYDLIDEYGHGMGPLLSKEREQVRKSEIEQVERKSEIDR